MAKEVRNIQWRLALVLCATACLTFVASAAGVRLTPVIENHVQRQIARQEAENGSMMYAHGYFDDGDYVLVHQIPNDDFSRGGVYFIGASEMKMTLMPWRLSSEEAELIHNYSIGDFRHRDVYHYTRMLVEQAGLLAGGPDRVTVVLGLSTEMTRDQTPGYVESLFERHGLYEYEWSGQMRMTDLSPVERAFRLGRNDANRFLSTLLLSPNDVGHRRRGEQATSHQVWPKGWRPIMDEEVEYLARTIDYLQARGVNVRTIYPPQASWREMDYSARYFELVSAVLAARSVPMTDQRDLLIDDEFSDAVHPLYPGQVKLHNAYVALARDALVDMRLTSRAQLTGAH